MSAYARMMQENRERGPNRSSATADYEEAQRLVNNDEAIPLDLAARLAVEGIDVETIEPTFI